MKCLVTGGAGFIGSNLALELEKNGNEVTIIDNFSSGHKENIKDFKGKVIDVDVSIPFEEKLEGCRFDVIFHQAAITDPRYDNDEETLRQNVQGFDRAIKLAKKQKSKLIYASTASLYGNGPSPQREDQPKELLSAYAQSKLIMDEMASHNFSDMHIVGLRYFNVFGPNEALKGRPASMIYHLAKQIKSGKNPRLFKNGEHKRDHIYVKDCVEANLKAMGAPSGVYNVGTGIGTSFNELVKVLSEVLGKDLEIEYFDMPYDPKTYQMNTQADTKIAEKYLKFKAGYTLKKGIEEYMESI
jgi:ADP-L-glycero-D-manno-heptose 6-epimerase